MRAASVNSVEDVSLHNLADFYQVTNLSIAHAIPLSDSVRSDPAISSQ